MHYAIQYPALITGAAFLHVLSRYFVAICQGAVPFYRRFSEYLHVHLTIRPLVKRLNVNFEMTFMSRTYVHKKFEASRSIQTNSFRL